MVLFDAADFEKLKKIDYTLLVKLNTKIHGTSADAVVAAAAVDRLDIDENSHSYRNH